MGFTEKKKTKTQTKNNACAHIFRNSFVSSARFLRRTRLASFASCRSRPFTGSKGTFFRVSQFIYWTGSVVSEYLFTWGCVPCFNAESKEKYDLSYLLSIATVRLLSDDATLAYANITARGDNVRSKPYTHSSQIVMLCESIQQQQQFTVRYYLVYYSRNSTTFHSLRDSSEVSSTQQSQKSRQAFHDATKVTMGTHDTSPHTLTCLSS